MVTWVVFLMLGLVLGMLAGYCFGRLDDSGDRQSVVLKHSLEETEKGFRDYQQKVQEHFIKTGELVNAMTKSYQDIHAHLADSAKLLCDYPQMANTLDRLTRQALVTDATSQHPIASRQEAQDLAVEALLGVEAQVTQETAVREDSTATNDTGISIEGGERIVH